MKLLLLGCARSGTGYAAHVLRACGLRCGHEQVIGAQEALGLRAPRWDGWDAESSWLAAFDPARWEPDRVGLQVRHPLRVAASWLAKGTMNWQEENPGLRIYRAVWAYWRPQVLTAPTHAARILAAMACIMEAALPAAELVWRVEDGLPLRRLARWADRPLRPQVQVPTNVNTKGPTLPLAAAAEVFGQESAWPRVAALYGRWYEL